VVLSAPDESSLANLHHAALAAGYAQSAFREPDFGLALTAVALEPAAHRLVSHLPLALSRREEVRT
jgi:hypothetical protein